MKGNLRQRAKGTWSLTVELPERSREQRNQEVSNEG